jgi:hypothetical protein
MDHILVLQKNVPNRQVPTVVAAFKHIIALYARRGFKIRAINADPEFEPLQAELPSQVFNFCAQNKHVPEIERYVWTIKDQVWSCYNTLPF